MTPSATSTVGQCSEDIVDECLSIFNTALGLARLTIISVGVEKRHTYYADECGGEQIPSRIEKRSCRVRLEFYSSLPSLYK